MQMNEQNSASAASQSSEHAARGVSKNKLILNHMLQGDMACAELARALNMPLVSLAQWIANPMNLKTLEGLARLEDVRTQMLVSRYRASAAAGLIRIATDGAARLAQEPLPSRHAGELARRACVDLLGINMPVFSPRPGDGQAPAFGGGRPPSDAAILRAFEELAKSEPGADG